MYITIADAMVKIDAGNVHRKGYLMIHLLGDATIQVSNFVKNMYHLLEFKIHLSVSKTYSSHFRYAP